MCIGIFRSGLSHRLSSILAKMCQYHWVQNVYRNNFYRDKRRLWNGWLITSTVIGNNTLIARFMGPIWVRQDPCGPHVGPMNFDIWDIPFCYVGVKRTQVIILKLVQRILVCKKCQRKIYFITFLTALNPFKLDVYCVYILLGNSKMRRVIIDVFEPNKIHQTKTQSFLLLW